MRIPNLLPLLVLAAVGCDDGEREPTYFDPRLSARVLVNVAVADTQPVGGVAVAVTIRNLGFQPITLSTPAVQLEVRDRRTGRVLALGRFDAPDAIQRLPEVGRGESVVEIARWSGELTTLDGRELAGRAAPGTYVIRASTQVLRPSLRRIVGDSAVVQLRATR